MRLLTKWLVVLCVLAGLTGCQRENAPPLSFKGSDISGASFGGDFSLTGQDGKTHRLSEYRGKVVALFFGYTHCPDVCPTTLLEYASALKQPGIDADKVQVLFVSVDPERDTREVLASYVPHFDPRFLGLTGQVAEVNAVMNRFRIVAQKVNGAGGSYTIDHSAGSYLFDKQGKLRVYEPYATPSSSLAHDIQELLR